MTTGLKLRHSGFTLIELSVLIVIIGMLLLVATLAIPRLSERSRLDTTSVSIDEVATALVSFAAINSRLPCPDINGDGLEGTAGTCAPADVVGRVPYRALGFPDPVLDEAHLPVRYAVYRNSGAAADLAALPLPNRFIPVLPGDPPTLRTYTGAPAAPVLDLATPVTNGTFPAGGINSVRVTSTALNDLDFCLALRNAKNAAANPGYVNTREATNRPNSAFVLVSGGVEDADGDAAGGVGQAFDGVNESVSLVNDNVDFESPARRRNDSSTVNLVYDDLVFAMPFNLLESKLSCAAVIISVTSSANVAIAAAHALVQAENAQWGAQLGKEMAEAAVIFSAFAVATGAIGTIAAAIELAGAIGACSSAVATSCGAVVSAGVAVGLSVAGNIAAIATVVIAALALTEADTALAAAVATVPGVFAHADKTRLDALAADARGGQL